MLVELKLNEEKVKRYNERLAELRKEYPNEAEWFKDVHELSDEFSPYAATVAAYDWSNYIVIEKDKRNNGVLSDDAFKGVYLCGFNAEHSLEMLTDYQEKRVRSFDSPIYWSNYGIADNASQVLDYYEELCKKYGEYMENSDFIILMTPIFKEDEPENGGWRWHKWGRYIGKYEPKHEYIYDEEDIDFVYCFHIYEVEKCQDYEMEGK